MGRIVPPGRKAAYLEFWASEAFRGRSVLLGGEHLYWGQGWCLRIHQSLLSLLVLFIWPT